MTEELSVADAAKYLDLSKEALHKAVRENRLPALPGEGPARLSLAAVEEFHQLRRVEQIARLARSGETPVSVAAKVRARLHAAELGMPRSMAEKLAAMPSDWRALFNRAELAAAGVRDGQGCRWCKAGEFAAFLGARPVEYSEAYAELFGGPPCGVCGPGLLRPFMASLAARVRGGAVRASEPVPRPSAAERARAAEWASQRAVTAAARPVQDDDGRAMVARRRREVQARLKDARRRGDTKHALALQQQMQALIADAARVDGRAPSRPGRLACGHLLAAGCGCPRRASVRGQR